MPLLRLLHQISSMYQNARATQIGLREQRPLRGKDNNLPTHHKEGSYSGVTLGNTRKKVDMHFLLPLRMFMDVVVKMCAGGHLV